MTSSDSSYKQSALSAPTSKINLLIVDDEQPILNALKRVFRDKNYVLYLANNAQKALQILSDTEIDVLISDINMPDISGKSLLSKVMSFYPNITRIALSGNSKSEDILDVVNQVDLFGYITKPWDELNLKTTVNNAIEKKNLKQELKKAHKRKSEEQEHLIHKRTKELIKLNDTLEGINEEEKTLTHLLKLAINENDLTNYLNKTVQLLIDSVSWLQLLHQGAILLNDKKSNNKQLNLAAHYNLAPEIQTLCTTVAYGHCLCGRAAEQMQVQFSNCLTDEHEVHFEGMSEHGHYNLPIIYKGELFGVLALYLPHGHQKSEKEISFLRRVTDVISLGIKNYYSMQELKRAKHDADSDGLMGLYNRRYLDEFLSNEWNRHVRNHQTISLLMIDIDYFKPFNDTYGHDGGDECLIQVAKIIQNNAKRPADLAARYGGEEFTIILPDTDTHGAQMIAESLLNELREAQIPHAASQVADFVTMSIGIGSMIPEKFNQSKQLLLSADKALYQAKKQGRNRVIISQYNLSE